MRNYALESETRREIQMKKGEVRRARNAVMALATNFIENLRDTTATEYFSGNLEWKINEYSEGKFFVIYKNEKTGVNLECDTTNFEECETIIKYGEEMVEGFKSALDSEAVRCNVMIENTRKLINDDIIQDIIDKTL